MQCRLKPKIKIISQEPQYINLWPTKKRLDDSIFGSEFMCVGLNSRTNDNLFKIQPLTSLWCWIVLRETTDFNELVSRFSKAGKESISLFRCFHSFSPISKTQAQMTSVCNNADLNAHDLVIPLAVPLNSSRRKTSNLWLSPRGSQILQ